jgi:tetratricopeptide (TPR) repeat protein
VTGQDADDLRAAHGVDAETVALGLLWLLALAAPELLAGVYPWGMLSIALAALAAFAAALWASRNHLPAPSWLDGAVLLALGYTALQALPLPCSWVAALAPDSALELLRVHELLSLPAPHSCVLTRDPGATREEIVKGIAIVAAYGAARVLVQRGQRRAVLLSVAGAGALLSVVTLAHVVTDATTVFGVYAPTEILRHELLGPVLNLNALGGLLALCVPMLVALALSADRGPDRLGLLLATLLTTGLLLLTRSRGAVAALAFGLLVLGALTLWARRRRRPASPVADVRVRLARVAMPLAIAVAVGVAVLGTYAELAAEFRGGGLDKLELIARSAAFVREQPWLGVGRGAFASAFARAHQGPTRFDHAENLVVQWAAEWGLPVALALLLAVLHALVRSVLRLPRSSERWERTGALAGVLAIGAQNLVDLGLELVGIAVLGALALACAVGSRRALGEASSRSRGIAGALWVAMALPVALLAAPIQRDHLPYADRELRELLAREARPAFRARLRPALLAHPGSPVLAVLGASDALRRDAKDTLAWINRSQELAQGWALPHLFAAQWLWNHGHHAQGLLELSVAARVDLHGSRALTCAIAARDPDGVLGIAPKTADPELFLELASECVGRDSVVGLRLEAGLAKLQPNAPGPLLRSLARLVQRGEADRALAELRRAPPQLRRAPGAVELEVAALMKAGRPQEALQALQHADPAGANGPSLLRLEIEVRTALKDQAGLQQVFERLRGLADGPAELVDAYRREAAAWRALGRQASALAAYEQARSISNDTGVLREIARLAAELGDDLRARRAYAELCALDPTDTASCQISQRLAPTR